MRFPQFAFVEISTLLFPQKRIVEITTHAFSSILNFLLWKFTLVSYPHFTQFHISYQSPFHRNMSQSSIISAISTEDKQNNISWLPETLYRLMDCVYQSEAHLSTKNWHIAELMFFNGDPDPKMAAIYDSNKKVAGQRLRSKYMELRNKAKIEIGTEGGSIGNLSAKTVDRPPWYKRLQCILDDIERAKVEKTGKKLVITKRRVDMEHINKVTLAAGLAQASVLEAHGHPASSTPLNGSVIEETICPRKRPKLQIGDVKVLSNLHLRTYMYW
jgi:hypothetical protein